MSMVAVGIDPGLDGAVAIIHQGGRVEFHDTPTVRIGKKRDYDLPGMAEIMRRLDDIDVAPYKVLAGLELVHSMPGQGVASMFSFGGGFRAWEMALVAFKIPYELVSPQRWKKAMMDGQRKDKDASRVVACRLFPGCADELKLKKHHGRADALLVAEFLRRRYGFGNYRPTER